MNFKAWMKSFWKPESTICKCPKCGSTDVTHFSVISNFAQVINADANAQYCQTYKCNNCGYTEQNTQEDFFKFSGEIPCPANTKEQ